MGTKMNEHLFQKVLIIGCTILGILHNITTCTAYFNKNPNTLFFAGFSQDNPCPYMGQQGDYLPKFQEKHNQPIQHVEGFSMGAGMAAHVVAQYLRNNQQIQNINSRFIPKTLLCCSGFTHGTDLFKRVPGTVIHPVLNFLQCIPFFGTLATCIGKAVFPGFNPFPWAEHPITSIQYVAKYSNMPIIFVHEEADQLISINHSYRNYLAAITTRGSPDNIYLLTASNPELCPQYPHVTPLHQNFWNLPATRYAEPKKLPVLSKVASIRDIIDKVYAQTHNIEVERGINLSLYQPTKKDMQKLLRRDNAEQWFFWLSKIAICATVAMRFSSVRDKAE